MADVYDKMKEMGITLPAPPARGGVYTPVREFGAQLLYCSGCGPKMPNGETVTGKLGREVTLEDGQRAARLCMLNLLANLEEKLGDLNRIRRFVKVLAFVASDSEFYQQPQVVNGGSELLIELFGEEIGCPARSAIGVNVLPGNIACEIEVLVEYDAPVSR